MREGRRRFGLGGTRGREGLDEMNGVWRSGWYIIGDIMGVYSKHWRYSTESRSGIDTLPLGTVHQVFWTSGGSKSMPTFIQVTKAEVLGIGTSPWAEMKSSRASSTTTPFSDSAPPSSSRSRSPLRSWPSARPSTPSRPPPSASPACPPAPAEVCAQS